MGSFSISHYLIVFAIVAGIVWLILWLMPRARELARPKRLDVPSLRDSPDEERLEKLASLRRKNLISEEEFERKRAEILRDL